LSKNFFRRKFLLLMDPISDFDPDSETTESSLSDRDHSVHLTDAQRCALQALQQGGGGGDYCARSASRAFR
jgi:hypothetical protein